MSTGTEFYDPSGRLLFSSVRPPFIFAGKVDVGTNAGTAVRSTANNQDSLAPNLNGVESVTVSCPADTLFVAATGTKTPSGINIFKNTSNNQWSVNFIGLSGSTCTLYFFKKHSGVSSSSQGLEFYDSSGKVIFDVLSKPMRIIQGNSDTQADIPSGKNYAVMTQQYEISVGAIFTGQSQQGNRGYTRYYTGGAYTTSTSAGLSRVNTDIVQTQSGDSDTIVVQRPGKAIFVDVTGY